MAHVGTATPDDRMAVVRTIDALRCLAGEPSEEDVMAVMRESGWSRRHDEWFTQGCFFALGA